MASEKNMGSLLREQVRIDSLQKMETTVKQEWHGFVSLSLALQSEG